ncbi:MAG: hypothetical protein NVSMB12_18580 [Acidimicrobiales bacterium]
MAAAEFRVLGPLAVWVDGCEVPVSAPKERHLLGVLALRHPHPVSTDRLIEELWPDGPPDDPVASVRVLVSRLRRRIDVAGSGAAIRAETGGYVLDTATDHIDACRFVAHVDAGASLLAAGQLEDGAAEYRKGLALWRGDVAADLPLGVSMAATLGDLEARRVEAHARCAEAELALGHHVRLVAELQEVLYRHPENEELARHLMVALARCGRYAEALRVGADLRRRLSVAGLPVSGALAEVEAAILAPEDPASAEAENPDGPVPTTDTPAPAMHERSWPRPKVEGPLIGRREELRALAATLRQARSGGLQVAVVEGQAGTGKSQLMAATAEQATDEGWTVLFGSCDAERRRPYHGLLVALEPVLAGLDPQRRRRLAAFDRAAHGRQGSMATAAARTDAFDRLATVLGAFAQDRPVLLMLDDVQWLDPAACAVLRHLVAVLGEAPVAIVLTTRPELLGEAGALISDVATTRVQLGPLSFADVLSLVSELRGSPLTAAERRGAHSVWARTGGNPYLASEWARDLVSSGHLALVADRDPAFPVDIKEAAGVLVDLRMVELRAHERNVLEAAAIHGMEIPLAVVEAVVGDAALVRNALDAASRTRLVRREPGRPGSLAFSHALVREALVANLPTTRQMFLHDRITTVLEGDATERTHLQEIAFHALAAAPLNLRRAVEHGERAAHDALSQFGFEDAERLYRRCADLIADGAPVSADLAADVSYGIAECASITRPDELGPALADAYTAARASGDPTRLARVALHVPVWSDPSVTGRSDPVLTQAARDALAAVGHGDPVLRSRLCSALCRQLPSGEREGVLRDAVDLAEATGDKRALLDALGAFVTVGGPDADMTALLRRADELVASSEDELGGPEAAAMAALERAHICAIADRARLADAVAVARSRADQAGRPYFHVLTSWWETDQLILTGPLEAAEARLAEAVDETLAASVPTDFAMAMSGNVLGLLRYHQGRLGELESVARMLAEMWTGGDSAWAFAAMAALHAGNRAGAAEIIDRLAQQDFAGIAQDSVWLPSIGILAVVAAQLGNVPVATRLRVLLEPYAGLWGWDYVVTIAPVDYALGTIDLAVGDLPGAVHHLERAALASHDVGAAAWEAWSRLDLAQAHWQRGESHLARGNREEALALAQRGGFFGVLHRDAELAWDAAG